MLKEGILNPGINSLLSRIRHTNSIVIADRGFPFYPEIETIDISLADGIPEVLDVLTALRKNFIIGKAWMAKEFIQFNTYSIKERFSVSLSGILIDYEPHETFKKRIPYAIGLIRTAGIFQFSNIILESA